MLCKLCKVLIVTVGLFTGACVGAQGQTPDNAPPAEFWQQASRRNWYVRVITVEADTMSGRVQYRNGEARVGGRELPFGMQVVERRLESGGGSLVGAIVGALILGVAGAGLDDIGDTAPSDGIITPAIGVGIGGLIGVLAGAAVAPAKVSWGAVWSKVPQ